MRGLQDLAIDKDDKIVGVTRDGLFSINSTIAGLLLSAIALTTRRWALAFVAAMGCTIVSFEGLVAIWSRQTVPQAGPSFGLVLAVISMFVLAIQWLRIAWSRS